MIIYIANKDENKELYITNLVSTQSVVYINDVVFDDVTLADGINSSPNLRVLKLDLKNGDTVSVDENQLITYTIK